LRAKPFTSPNLFIDAYQVVVHAPAPLCLVAANGEILFANTECERLFGYGPGDLTGHPIEILMPENARGRHSQLRSHFTTNPDARRIGSGRDLAGLRRDGTQIPIEIGLNAITVPGHEPVIVAAIVDLALRKEHERLQREHAAELERLNADIEEFAYLASHDLRQPLRAIYNLIDWLIDDIGDTLPGKSAEDLDMVQRRIRRMDRLLTDLLAYSRATRGASPIEHVDLGDMLREIQLLLDPPAGYRVIWGPMPSLLAEREPLDQVLRNLIGNAIKHRSSDQGEVEIGAVVRDGIAHFRVSDDGPGIAPQFHEQVFKMFQTLASRDEVEASGMGLTLVKRLVEARGGSITVESATGNGATFRFTWPAAGGNHYGSQEDRP
jgi:PAS domain S-box-containing protein